MDNITLTRDQSNRSGEYVKLTITDTGHGTSEDVMSRIFDPFFTTKKEGEGTGLGLSVVDGIVKNHNGWITVASENNEGARFDVFFPISKDEKNIDRPSALDTSSLFNDSKSRILLVDDEKVILIPIQSICRIGSDHARHERASACTTIERDSL